MLFRIFHYPATGPRETDWSHWGVGEHTDYGLLTLLAQDGWAACRCGRPAAGSRRRRSRARLVCNIGDMLERMTGGRFKSTPHRVLNRSGHDRLSFPLFFDPDFDARDAAASGRRRRTPHAADDRPSAGTAASVHDFEGTYGDYLLGKVGKVFPQLKEATLGAQ